MYRYKSLTAQKLIAVLAITGSFLLLTGCNNTTSRSGEELFTVYCNRCHPQGRNILNPAKTLYKQDLDAGNIKAEEDIISIMRNPPQGMYTFDADMISDEDAHKIAQYVLSCFDK